MTWLCMRPSSFWEGADAEADFGGGWLITF